MAAAGRNCIQAYGNMAVGVALGGVSAFLNAPVASLVVQGMLHMLPREMPPEVKLRCCQDYFASEHFAELPNEWLSSRIFATLKQMVKRGAYANREAAVGRLSGVFYDVQHISTYAPYCDAFFMDQAMADLVRQPTVGLEQRYGTKVFSLNNLEEFMAWLDSLQASMTEEHRQGLNTAYAYN